MSTRQYRYTNVQRCQNYTQNGVKPAKMDLKSASVSQKSLIFETVSHQCLMVSSERSEQRTNMIFDSSESYCHILSNKNGAAQWGRKWGRTLHFEVLWYESHS